MKHKLAGLVLWLFVIDLGVALGAGLYEARVVIPTWVGTDPQSWPNTGLAFWVYVTTVPLTLLTLAGAVLVWRERGEHRRWWLAALAAVVVERLATFAYFIPTMIELISARGMAQVEIDASLATWATANWMRHDLNLAALLAALQALVLRGAQPREGTRRSSPV